MADTEAAEVNNPNAQAATPVAADAADPAAQFRGVGVNFKAKLIGIDDVVDSRGDKMCQDSILKLKAAVKISGLHKQKVLVNISLDGLKISDLLTGEVLHSHAVNKISFVARDLTDRRAFAYVYSADDGKHKLFGVKTAKVAETLVLSLRDLFQVVYDLRKSEMEGGGGQQQQQPQDHQMQAANQQVGAVAAVVAQQDNLGGMLQTIESMDQFNQQQPANDMFMAQQQQPPASPTPNADLFGSETFGAQLQGNNEQTVESLASDLQSLSMPAEQPPPVPGATLTNDQILNAFRNQQQSQQQQQQQGGFPAMQQQQQQMPGFQQQFTPQPGVAAGGGMMMAANPFGGNNQFVMQGMHQQQQQQHQQIPQIPPRAVPQQPRMSPNPFGGGSVGGGAVMSPQTTPRPGDQQPASQPAANDPFGDILSMGSGGQATSQKDMFKNFQMTPPAATAAAGNAGIDDYLMNSKGVVPVAEQQQQQPLAMPRSAAPGGGGGGNTMNLFG